MLYSTPSVRSQNGAPVCGALTPAVLGYNTMSTNTREVEDSDDHECPTCGRLFGTQRGMKIHHASTHGDSIAGVTVECDGCGGEIKHKNPTKAENGEHNVCSQECLNEVLGYEGSVEFTCDYCRETGTKQKPKLDPYEHSFCSADCRDSWMSEKWAGGGHPKFGSGDKYYRQCANCGETIKVYGVKKRQEHENHFCDRECSGEYYSREYAGEGHPQWNGGSFPYGAGWDKAKKEAVRERDNYQCAGCGVSQAEHIESTGEKLHVHHIQKARTLNDVEKRNAKDNLISLCHECHPKWEQMSPLRPEVLTE